MELGSRNRGTIRNRKAPRWTQTSTPPFSFFFFFWSNLASLLWWCPCHCPYSWFASSFISPYLHSLLFLLLLFLLYLYVCNYTVYMKLFFFYVYVLDVEPLIACSCIFMSFVFLITLVKILASLWSVMCFQLDGIWVLAVKMTPFWCEIQIQWEKWKFW